jgi:hypothetical protein
MTDNHSRKINYFTQNQNVIDSIVDNSASVGHTSLRDQTTYYSDHSANLPNTASSNKTNATTDHIFGYEFPMYEAGTYHWACAGNGNRWEVDDFPTDASKTTVHRVWVRLAGGI